MAIWREFRSSGAHSLPHGAYRAFVHQTGGPEMPVTIAYYRFTQSPVPRVWRPSADNCVEVSVPEAVLAPNLEDGKTLARATMRKLESGEFIATESPFIPPIQPKVIAEVEHRDLLLRATILQWPDFYEVRTFGYVPNGYAMPASSPSISQDLTYEWGKLDMFERLLADTETEARAAAQEEIDRLVKAGHPIRERR